MGAGLCTLRDVQSEARFRRTEHQWASCQNFTRLLSTHQQHVFEAAKRPDWQDAEREALVETNYT